MSTLVTEHVFAHADTTYRVHVRLAEKPTQKTRVYVEPYTDRSPLTEFTALADYIGAPSVFTKRGDFPPLDRAFDKMNREIRADMREVLDAGLSSLAEADDRWEPWTEAKVSFSKRAGCSCGCSPGFILNGYGNGYDVWVSKV